MEIYYAVQAELKDLFTSEAILVQNSAKIVDKASIVSLMELIFRTMSDKRTFTFAKISEVTKVPEDKVELLVMRALSLGLVKGYITEVEHTATFTWVLPRVLDKSQFSFISKKLDDWLDMTHRTITIFEAAEHLDN